MTCVSSGLSVKWPPQTHVLKSCSPAISFILSDVGNFRKWGLDGKSKSLGECPWAFSCLFLLLFLPPSPLVLATVKLRIFHHVLPIPWWSFCITSLFLRLWYNYAVSALHRLNPVTPWAKWIFLLLSCVYQVRMRKIPTNTDLGIKGGSRETELKTEFAQLT